MEKNNIVCISEDIAEAENVEVQDEQINIEDELLDDVEQSIEKLPEKKNCW